MPRAHFNIHGVPLEISANHPLLLRTFTEDLRWFRTDGGPSPRGAIRLKLTTLPVSANGDGYPEPFAPYREMGLKRTSPSGDTVTCYGRSAVSVISSFREPSIHAAVLPEMALLIDPAYHYCFTQPANFWFKRRGLFFLHAGCVSEGSEGILIVGQSRAGKSTLCLSAVRGGFKFLSDEQPLLSFRDGYVQTHSFPRQIRLHRAQACFFRELAPLLKSSPLDRLVFPIRKFWAGCVSSSCRPRILLFPKFHKRGSLRVSPLHPSGALARLLQDDYFVWYKNGPWGRLSHQHLALFEKLIQQTSAFSLEYGHRDLSRIPSLFRRLLNHG